MSNTTLDLIQRTQIGAAIAEHNLVQIFDEREILGKHFCMYGSPDEPLFLAKDVAAWIDYDTNKVGQMLSTIEEEEKFTSPIFYSGQVREMWFVSEDGLYEILMQSRKPIAREFKKQVKEILKSVRKHGIYATDQLINDPDLAIKAFTALKEERLERQRLETQVQELQPKATYCDTVLQSKSTVPITVIAKDYGMSAIALNMIFCELGVHFKLRDTWVLKQRYADKGYTRTRTLTVGDRKTTIITGWTQKGRLFIYNLLKVKREIVPQNEGIAK